LRTIRRPKSRCRRSRHPLFRCFLVCVAAVSLVAQLSSSIHLFLVPHVSCPEHGELIHESQHTGSSAAHTEERSSAGGAQFPAVQGVPERDGAHDHDHCFAATDRRDGLCVASCAWSVAGGPPSSATSPFRASTLGSPAIALLLLAPKNSPPV
jgi:hypothetical protein